MKRKIGVSVASLLPWSLGKDGFYKSIEIAAKTGFDGLQILPMRRWQAEETLVDWVISFGDAWNSGSFFGAIEREIYQFVTRKKCAMEEKPLFLDWLLFGSQKQSEKAVQGFMEHFPEAIYCSNGWAKYCFRGQGRLQAVNEICPEMFPKSDKFTYDEISDEISRIKNGIVWDTEHVLRLGRHGEPPITENWRVPLDKLKPEQIKLVHVKPHLPAGSELPQMLSDLAKKTKGTLCPVILESKPILKSKKKTIDWLKEYLDFLRMHFD